MVNTQWWGRHRISAINTPFKKGKNRRLTRSQRSIESPYYSRALVGSSLTWESRPRSNSLYLLACTLVSWFYLLSQLPFFMKSSLNLLSSNLTSLLHARNLRLQRSFLNFVLCCSFQSMLVVFLPYNKTCGSPMILIEGSSYWQKPHLWIVLRYALFYLGFCWDCWENRHQAS